MRVGLFLAVLALCAGCISERSGYAAYDPVPPRPGATYRDAVTTLDGYARRGLRGEFLGCPPVAVGQHRDGDAGAAPGL